MEIFKIFDYFRYKIFANTKIPDLFLVKFENEKKIVLSFAKQENPQIKSFRIALVCKYGLKCEVQLWVPLHMRAGMGIANTRVRVFMQPKQVLRIVP